MLGPGKITLIVAVIIFVILFTILALLFYNCDGSAYYRDTMSIPLSAMISLIASFILSILVMMGFSVSTKGLHYNLNYCKYERDKAIEQMAKAADADDKAILAKEIISLEKRIAGLREELGIPQVVEEESK